MAYMMLAKDDPVAAAAQIYAGYTEHVKLTEVNACGMCGCVLDVNARVTHKM
jgi:hypothetical protein